jgi:hypothetical protein
MLFLAILHYKMHLRPAQDRPRLSPARKLRHDVSSGTIVGGIFSAQNNRVFSGLAQKMLRYSWLEGLKYGLCRKVVVQFLIGADYGAGS